MSTTARRPDVDAERLSKVVGLLDSPVGGERQATLEAARRLAARSRFKIAECFRPVPAAGEWRARTRELLRRPGLDVWQRQLLEGNARQRSANGGGVGR